MHFWIWKCFYTLAILVIEKKRSTDLPFLFEWENFKWFWQGFESVWKSLKGSEGCVPQGSILGRFLLLIYVNDIPQPVKCDLFLHADDACHACQRKDINKIENQLNGDFFNICDWFVDNKLSIHFGEDKTKSILFASKFKRKNI